MATNSQYQLLLTTCPNQETANQLAHILVENHLAACISMVPNIQSVYEWQNEIVSDNEVLLLIKTHYDCYNAIEQTLLQQHPYEVPELIAVSIDNGLPAYLSWLGDIVSQANVT